MMSSGLKTSGIILPAKYYFNVKLNMERANYLMKCILVISAVQFTSGAVPSPPRLTKQPPNKELLFMLSNMSNNETGTPLILECEAEGEPPPKYKWVRNGKEFKWQANDRINQLDGRGTLNFTYPLAGNVGLYQCFAENQWGTATSNSVFLKMEWSAIPNETNSETVTAVEGQPLVFGCNPPDGYPKQEVFWIRKNFGERKEVSSYIIDSPRITADPQGNLWFSNITRADASSVANEEYACVVKSRNRSTEYLLERKFLKVNRSKSFHAQQVPQMQYASQKETIAIKGSTLVLWCIFSGSPLPYISWRKIRDIMSPSRCEETKHNKALKIKNVSLSDAGMYRCTAFNGIGPLISHHIRVTVHAPPYFESEPEVSLDTAKSNRAMLRCRAAGNPPPTIEWTFNRKPMNEHENKPVIEIERLSRQHTGNYGCNASNALGYVYKELSLNVLGTPPKIRIAQSQIYVAVGNTATLTCGFSEILPLEINWMKNDAIFYHRVYIMNNETQLRIPYVHLTDAGQYICQVKNTFGAVNSSVTLFVKSRTRIYDKPENQHVAKGSNVTWRCRVEKDSSANLTLDWWVNEQKINYTGRFSKLEDNSLNIKDVIKSDSGRYTCVVSTGFDTASASAVLKVEDDPDSPEIVDLRCKGLSANVTLRSNPDAPTSTYLLEYNTSFFPNVWKQAYRGPISMEFIVILTLKPWRNHTFRVTSINKFGRSTPSKLSTVCLSDPNVPDRNPENVSWHRNTSSNLIISWTPVPREEHNGPNLTYVVEWKPENDNTSYWKQKYLTDWKTSQWEMSNLPSYTAYKIRVRSANQVGNTKKVPEYIIAYSGMGEPEPSANILMPISMTTLTVFIALLVVGLLLIKNYYRKSLLSHANIQKFLHGDKSVQDDAYKMPYDKKKYEIDCKSFSFDDKEGILGCGEFGMVCKGNIQTGDKNTSVAVKMPNPNKMHRSILTGLLSEIKVLAHVGKHENITELLGANTKRLKQGKIYIFLELCPLGSLEKYLRKLRPVQDGKQDMKSQAESYDSSSNSIEMKASDPFPDVPELSQDLYRWSKEICNGMAFLATKHVVHADLAARNVLLGANKEAKVCDFGLSRRMYNYASYVKSQQEPLPWKWMAPESLRVHEFNEKTDVWSFGVTLWEIFSLGDSPYQGMSWDMNFVQLLQRGLRLKEPEFNERDMYSIMRQCWNFNPDSRPSFEDLSLNFYQFSNSL